MKVKTIKTSRILPTDRGLSEFLDKNIPRLKERSVLVITSKVAAILEGAVEPMEDKDGRKINKKELIIREADRWLAPPSPGSPVILTAKNGVFVADAGIDGSNGGGWYILWPKDPQRTVNAARRHLMKKFSLKALGVLMVDSVSTPLRWGTRGAALAYSGIVPLNDYIGTKDLFGLKLRLTKANVADGLAAAAVLAMGEGAEQTPLAVIDNIPFVEFRKSNPSKKELAGMLIGMDEDLYAPLLKRALWKKGQGGRGK